MMDLKSFEERMSAGGRLTAGEALQLYREAPTYWLGRMADDMRRRKHPGRQVTYIIDRNVNYTNVCVARCNFCAFYREVGHSEGYVLGFEEIFRKIEETRALGGVQLLLQGGHNPDLPITWYEDLFRAVKQKFPDFKLHALSPPEVIHLSRQHSRRRRRDPRRPCAEAAQLLQQGDRRRMARRHAACPQQGPAHHGDDDVRDGRDRRRAPRAHVAAARASG
jgi:2-iminoacetate synthase ThiH